MYMEIQNQAQIMTPDCPVSGLGRRSLSEGHSERSPERSFERALERSPRQFPGQSDSSGVAISPKVIDYQGETVIFESDCIWFTSTYESKSKSFAAQISQELLFSLDANGFTNANTPFMESKSGSRCRRSKHQIFFTKPLGYRLQELNKY